MAIPIRKQIFSPDINLKDQGNKNAPKENNHEPAPKEEPIQQAPLPVEASALDVFGEYNIGLIVRRAVNKPLDGENDPNIIQPDGYENGFVFESLEEALKTMKLRATSCPGVYCELHNPNMSVSNYTHKDTTFGMKLNIR